MARRRSHGRTAWNARVRALGQEMVLEDECRFVCSRYLLPVIGEGGCWGL